MARLLLAQKGLVAVSGAVKPDSPEAASSTTQAPAQEHPRAPAILSTPVTLTTFSSNSSVPEGIPSRAPLTMKTTT